MTAAGARVDSEAAQARTDAPRDCGPGNRLHPTGGGSSSEQGPVLAGLASAPSLGPGPLRERNDCCAPARADLDDSRLFWADWVTDGCGEDGDGRNCCWRGGGAGVGPDDDGSNGHPDGDCCICCCGRGDGWDLGTGPTRRDGWIQRLELDSDSFLSRVAPPFSDSELNPFSPIVDTWVAGFPVVSRDG